MSSKQNGARTRSPNAAPTEYRALGNGQSNDSLLGGRKKATQNRTALEQAISLSKYGPVLPVKYGSKKCLLENWPSIVLSEDELPEHFTGRFPTNFGLLLGERANGLVDIDIDDDTALGIAADFLPATRAVFGRNSRPRSHWLYRRPGLASERYLDPLCPKDGDRAVLVEIRSTGCQTMAPGSKHPDGEMVRWDVESDPGIPEPAELLRSASRLAACTLLARYWPSTGSRHEAALAVSGALLQAGWSVEDAERFITSLTEASADEELEDRLGAVRDTAKALEQQKPITGLTKLRELFDRKLVNAVVKWLSLKPAVIRADCTDTGNGQRFIDQHGEQARYCHPYGKWYVWDGTRWAVDARGEVQRRCMTTARGIFQEAGAASDSRDQQALAKHALRPQERTRLEAMAWAARPALAISPDSFDRDPLLLNCQNGTVDLRTGELRPHDPEDLITRLVPTGYDASAKCPRWKAFLLEIMGNDEEMVAFLQRAVGYALTALTTEQCFFLLHGSGANGKSTFLETLVALFGDYGRPTEFRTLEARRSSDAVRNDLAALRGLRLVTSVEVGRQKRLDEALVKQLTGSDTITARFLYGEFFDFRPTFKLFLAANTKPVIHGTDEGIWRRVKMIPFDVTIPSDQRDRGLPSRLLAELSGILAWAVRGAQEWQATGLKPPVKVNAATEEYRHESDVLADFLQCECEVGDSGDFKVPGRHLYSAYETWAEKSGLEPLDQRLFATAMRERGFTSRPQYFPECKGTVRGYVGIRIKCRTEYAPSRGQAEKLNLYQDSLEAGMDGF